MNTKTTYLVSVAVSLVLIQSAIGEQPSEKVIGILRNVRADQQTIEQAIARAGKGKSVPRSVWLEVAADRRYPTWHRRLCLYGYFRHFARDITVAELSRDLAPTRIFRPSNVYCWSTVSALPEPFAHDNRLLGFQYYALMPMIPKDDRSAIVLKVRGASESRRPVDRPNELPANSPFLQALFKGKGGDKLHIVDNAIAEGD